MTGVIASEAMSSLLYFLAAIIAWGIAYATIESHPGIGLGLGGLGALIFLVGLLVNHSEHTRRGR